MAKKSPRIEVQIYTRSTERPGFYRFAPVRLLWWLVGVGIAVAGVLFFNPMQIWEKATDFRLWRLYKENMAIQRNLAKVKGAEHNAQSTLEEGEWLRQKVAELSGLPSSEGASSTIASPRRNPNESPTRNLQRIRQAHATFHRFRSALWENPTLADQMPLLHPVRQHQHIGNRFTMVKDPFTEQYLPHRGIDFIIPEGDTVIATGSGVVESVTTERGLGLTLKLRHTEQSQTLYGHLAQSLVPPGRSVRKGQPIALAGKTGRTSGPMVHYEVRLKGQPINPQDYFITP